MKKEEKREGEKRVEFYRVNSCGKVIEKEIFTIDEWKVYSKQHNSKFRHFYITNKGRVLLVEEKIVKEKGDKK